MIARLLRLLSIRRAAGSNALPLDEREARQYEGAEDLPDNVRQFQTEREIAEALDRRKARRAGNSARSRKGWDTRRAQGMAWPADFAPVHPRTGK